MAIGDLISFDELSTTSSESQSNFGNGNGNFADFGNGNFGNFKSGLIYLNKQVTPEVLNKELLNQETILNSNSINYGWTSTSSFDIKKHIVNSLLNIDNTKILLKDKLMKSIEYSNIMDFVESESKRKYNMEKAYKMGQTSEFYTPEVNNTLRYALYNKGNKILIELNNNNTLPSYYNNLVRVTVSELYTNLTKKIVNENQQIASEKQSKKSEKEIMDELFGSETSEYSQDEQIPLPKVNIPNLPNVKLPSDIESESEDYMQNRQANESESGNDSEVTPSESASAVKPIPPNNFFDNIIKSKSDTSSVSSISSVSFVPKPPPQPSSSPKNSELKECKEKLLQLEKKLKMFQDDSDIQSNISKQSKVSSKVSNVSNISSKSSAFESVDELNFDIYKKRVIQILKSNNNDTSAKKVIKQLEKEYHIDLSSVKNDFMKKIAYEFNKMQEESEDEIESQRQDNSDDEFDFDSLKKSNNIKEDDIDDEDSEPNPKKKSKKVVSIPDENDDEDDDDEDDEDSEPNPRKKSKKLINLDDEESDEESEPRQVIKSGRWDPDEDKLLLNARGKYEGKPDWNQIAKKVGSRDKRACESRYRRIQDGSPVKKSPKISVKKTIKKKTKNF